ncbi:MAG: SIS domain-containing protein [Anaerolineaceae bacterium]
MNFEDYATYKEISTQTIAWSQAIEIVKSTTLPDLKNYQNAIFVGCGSTYYLSIATAALFQTSTGLQSRAVPGSELLFNPQFVLSKNSDGKLNRTLLVAISRSGTTTETLRAVENFKKMNCGEVVVISNYYEKLSHLADISIVIPEGQEVSVAQTRSFSSMYVASAMFCARISNQDEMVKRFSELPAIGNRLIRDFEETARKMGEDQSFESFFFLGSNFNYGIACELSLKFKEMTLTHSEPFHFLEFRHGPMSMANEKVGIIGLVSESNFQNEMKVVEEMKQLGAQLFTIGETGTDISLNSQLPEYVRGVLFLPVIQLMAFFRSIKKGLNPDNPKNLTAVVELNL